MRPVIRVCSRIVEAKDDISLDTIRIVDEEIGNRGAVWDEAHSDSSGAYGVFAICTNACAIATDGRVAYHSGSGSHFRVAIGPGRLAQGGTRAEQSAAQERTN